jgi:alpha-L-rhamnosidase
LGIKPAQGNQFELFKFNDMKSIGIKTKSIFFLLLFSCGLHPFVCFSSGINVRMLKCEYVQNPLGIDNPNPQLSWTLVSSEHNQKQAAYELIVSDNIIDINKQKGNMWSTGKISSSQNLHINYEGAPLKPYTRYYWRVKVENQDGEFSPWSEPAWFETALLGATEWKAKWISDGKKLPVKTEDFYKKDPMPLFRKKFKTDKEITSARLYISGLGYYEAYLNGEKISDHVLSPGWTNYRKQILYSVYDVTNHIIKGDNIISAIVGNGWYNLLPLQMWGGISFREYLESGRPCLLAQLRITYSDGTEDMVVTDNTWQYLPGPVIKNSIFLGEHYDARLEIKGWLTPNAIFKDALKVKEVEGPGGQLISQMQPPIKVTKVIKPVGVKEVKPGIFVFDMGQNFAGVARIKVQGPGGTHIVLRYGEDIYEDGNINVMTAAAGQIKRGQGGPGAPEIAWQEDSYILKGEGREVWSPRFTFHGFRYVEVTGWQGTPTLNDIDGLCLSADIENVGSFTSSNPMFNKLYRNIDWTFRSNMFSVQSDCPGREKLGYGGDMFCTTESFCLNYNMVNFYDKVIQDYINDQRPLGGITFTAPFVGLSAKGPGDDSGSLGFQIGFPYLLKQLYIFYGNKNIIEENYEPFVRQVDFLIQTSNNLLYKDGWSDHESLDEKPVSFTETVFFYHHIKLAEEFAETLGKTEDAEKYHVLSSEIKSTINHTFLNFDTGQYANGTQTAQVFALWYDLTPDSIKTKVLDKLLLAIKERNGHLSTGIFGTKMLLDVLRENNLNDIAYQIVNKKDFPGWGYMLEKGATTLWETWAYSDNVYSQNHPMFGSVNEWFYRSLLGINAASPGFKKIIIMPQPPQGLSYAKGSYNSVYGPIKSEWEIKNQKFNLNVEIPVNTTAEIWLPAKDIPNITEGGNPVGQISNIQFLREEKGYAVYATGSGSYAFRSNYK